MDLLITAGLMLCILVGGVLAAKQSSTKEGKDPALVQIQQTMQVGFTWMLTSLVPFWRGPKVLAMIVLAVGLLTFLKGCLDAYQTGVAKAKATREAQENRDFNADQTDGGQEVLTGKALARRRRANKRAAARAALATSTRPEQETESAP